jgi:hypothetical protein
MKKATLLTLVWIILTCLGLIIPVASIGHSESWLVGTGLSYFNVAIGTERLTNILSQDVSLALSGPDVFAEYQCQFHQEQIWRQKLKIAMKPGRFGLFYDLSILGAGKYSGVGVLVSDKATLAQGTSFIDLAAVYREKGYGFNLKYRKFSDTVFGSIGFSYDKYRDLTVFGPSVDFGLRW